VVIGLIVFYATRYTRKAISKSFSTTTVQHDAPYAFTDAKKTEISDKKTPLLNTQTESPGESIFQQNDALDDDFLEERNDYDDDENMDGPLKAPSKNHHVTNDETDQMETRPQNLFDDEPTL